jgi:alpha-glucosidase
MGSFFKTKSEYELYSPNKSVLVELSCIKSALYYSVKKDGRARYGKSKLGMIIGKTDSLPVDLLYGNEIVYFKETEVKGREFTVYGRCEKRVENSVHYEVGVKNGDINYTLDIRVFDDGVAFRYEFTPDAGIYVFGEHTEFALEKKSTVYASFGCRHPQCNTALNGRDALCYECTYDEYDPKKPLVASERVKRIDKSNENRFYDYVLTPMTVNFSDGTFGAILESDVVNYYGSNLRPLGGYRFGLNTLAGRGRFETFKVKGAIKTPFRVLLVNDDLNGLYNNSIVNAVVEPSGGDFLYVKPGRSAWHWHVEVMRNRRLDFDMAKEYTIAAAKMGFEYNILDGGWRRMKENIDGKEHDEKDLLKILCHLGDKYGVGQICWGGYLHDELNPKSFTDKGKCDISTKDFIDMIADCGAKGAKIDFFRGEHDMAGGVNMYEDILKYGADKKLVFNFHGATKPSGQAAKYPNELSREGIRGMENYFYSPASYFDIAYAFTTLTFVRGLAGHGDWTPFIHDGIGLATLVLTDSPMNVISATNEDLLNSPAKEFIKSLPSSFDRTVVLKDTEFKKFVAMAKEKDGNWFVAGINHNQANYSHTVRLKDFVPDGTTWHVEIYYDTESGLRREERVVSYYDEFTFNLPADRGYVIRVDRLHLNRFGGEIDGAVEILSRDGDAVYYTIDDTDPISSKSRKLYQKKITLENSCYLRACVLKEGVPLAKIRYRFNKIESD